jgi:signal transduction histidine kinase
MALSHGAVLAAIVLALGTLLYVVLQRHLDMQATASVVAAAGDEADRVRESGPGAGPSDNDQPSSAAIQVALYLPDGRVVGEAIDVPAWLQPQATPTATIRARGEPVRVATIRVARYGRPVATVVAGRSLLPEQDLLARVRLLLLAGGLVAVVASMGAGWVLAGRALRPVRRAYQAQAGFAADASHELRTPLAFVRSGVEVLAEREPELGSDVLEEVDYLTGLTERLLDLARADSGSIRLSATPFATAALCRRVAERNQVVSGVQAEVVRPSIRTETEQGPSALGDPVAVQAALDALLENVSRHGGNLASITCSLAADRVRIAVADHGPGLSGEQRRRAFDRFFRSDASRARGVGGAGLGLSLARALISAQHGRLWLEETPGGGLTAVIELPAARPA